MLLDKRCNIFLPLNRLVDNDGGYVATSIASSSSATVVDPSPVTAVSSAPMPGPITSSAAGGAAICLTCHAPLTPAIWRLV